MSLFASRVLSVLSTLMLLLCCSSAHAVVTAKWTTSTGPGTTVLTDTAQEACQAQHDGWAPENPGPITATPYKGSWTLYECDWKTHADGPNPPTNYPINPLPSVVWLVCVDENDSQVSYALVPPGICISPYETRTSRPPGSFDNCSRPNPTDANPVIVSNGAKYEVAIDYQDADRRLTIARTYRSRYGTAGTGYVMYAFPYGIGDLWRLSFQWELVLNRNSFSQNGAFGVSTPDGSIYAFTLNTDGSVTPNNNGINDLSVRFVSPNGASVSYSAILSNGGQFVVTTSSGDSITMGLFVRGWSSQYLEGHPLHIIYRGGYTWNFGYGGRGEVQTITDNLGRSISFEWNYTLNADDTGELWPRAIRSIQLPDGTTLNYGYESYTGSQTDSQQFARLKTYERVSPDGVIVDASTYLYEDPRVRSALTGIVDRSGMRRATWEYDTNGHTTLSKHAGGVDQFSIAYSYTPTGTYHYRTVTNALGKQTTYTFKRVGSTQRELQLISVVGVASLNCLGTTESLTYDSNSRVASSTDSAGYQTRYTYGTDGRRQTVTEAYGTPLQRVTSYAWDPTFGVPTQIVKPDLTTDFTYDGLGRLRTLTQTDTTTHTEPYSTNGTTRQWSFSYYDDTHGLLRSVDGPLPGSQDTTQYDYNAAGYLKTVTNSFGHTWQITEFDGAGRPTKMRDPNGILTELSYYGDGRIQNRSTAGLTTGYEYDLVGNLRKVTEATGAWIEYTYDDARRLTDIRDEAGNRIHYTLDNAGNRKQQDVYDPTGTLRRSQSRVYDELSRLLEIHGAEQLVARLGYDLRGNPNSETQAPYTTTREFDALNRLFKITDAVQGVTLYEYDALDHLIAVTDPRGLVTRYTYDGFGNAIRVQSPDTGTSVYTFDLSGNVGTYRDAKGQLTTYSHDTLNRLRQITYDDASTVIYTYDQGVNGIGRLTGMADSSGSSSWSYDAHGRVTQKGQTVNGQHLITQYTYDTAGRRTHVRLPSGRVVRYQWLNGKVINVFLDHILNGAHIAVEMTHEPFGPPAVWRFGNGQLIERKYDLDGRMFSHSLGSIGYDALWRITSITQSNYSALRGSKTYGYDALDRLKSYQDAASTITYDYDATGNRELQGGTYGSVDFSVDPASNRLLGYSSGSGSQSFHYDLNGSMKGDGINSYGYDAAGRLSTAISSSASGSYRYNGLGQRTHKVVTPIVAGLSTPSLSATTLFAYDEDGHLIGEYDGSGNLVQETVWLDDLPLAVVKPDGTYYIHTDHLNTPRQIDNQVWETVWTWDTITFGGNTPSQPATGVNAFEYNLRFAGQYYDAETGLFQNWYRDYNANLGRYVESDPIGLLGGINTYAYVGSNPLSFTDRTGLAGEAALPALIPGLEIPAWVTNPVGAGLAGILYPSPIYAPDCELAGVCGGAFSTPHDKDSPTTASDGSASCPDKDPCKGIRKQLEKHRQKLRDYTSNPGSHDNLGKLGKGNDANEIAWRIESLTKQIAMWERELAKCEAQHGRN